MAQYGLLGALGCVQVNGQNLVHNAQKSVKGGLYRVAPLNGGVPMQNFLEHFCVRDEALPIAHQSFEQPLGVCLVRVRCAHKVHGNV